MLSGCSRRSSPIFLRKKSTQLLERSKPVTSNGHLCTLKLVPFYEFTPPIPSLVAERWRYSPPHQLGRYFSAYKEQYHSTASFYVEYGEIVVQTTCAYGNYHPQTLASFTGTPKGSLLLQGLFSYSVSVFSCSHPFQHRSCSKLSIAFFFFPSDEGRIFSLSTRIAALCYLHI